MRITASNTGKTITICWDAEVQRKLLDFPPLETGDLRVAFSFDKALWEVRLQRVKIGDGLGDGYKVGVHSASLFYVSCPAGPVQGWPAHGKIEAMDADIKEYGKGFKFRAPHTLPPHMQRRRLGGDKAISGAGGPRVAMELPHGCNAILALGASTFVFDLPSDMLALALADWIKRGHMVT